MNTLQLKPLNLDSLFRFDLTGRQVEMPSRNNVELPGVPKKWFYLRNDKPAKSHRKSLKRKVRITHDALIF
jgi:hypothetical protein